MRFPWSKSLLILGRHGEKTKYIEVNQGDRNAQGKIELIADKSSSGVQPSLTCAAVSPSS